MPDTSRSRATAFPTVLMLVTAMAATACGASSQRRAAQAVPFPAPQAERSYPVGQPQNPETWYLLAEWLSEKAKDATLRPDAARTLVLRGLEVNEQALTLNPVYYEALRLKDSLLRHRAQYENDGAVRQVLVAQADAARATADDLQRRYEAGR